jgi:3-mercaptopropionate dioxygenase
MNERLRCFVDEMTALVGRTAEEKVLLPAARSAMQHLVAIDDWLADTHARPHPAFYQQYLLHCDDRARFSVVSFVWGPGQKTPVHDHTVWGVIGMLRGAELASGYDRIDGRLHPGRTLRLSRGDVELVSPTLGDIHQVRNAYDDRVSISIHCYGADIGRVRRHVYDADSGAAKEFVSGYANAQAAGSP